MQKPKFSRRDFLRIIKEAFVTLTIAGTGMALDGFLVEPNWIDVEEVEISLARLPKAFAGFRIMQISDIHIGYGWMNPERLAHMVQTALTHPVDLTVLTGDYVFGRGWDDMMETLSHDFAREISKLKLPILSILGNHDHWMDAARVRAMLSAAGVIELQNDVYVVERDRERLFIAGVDDIWEKKHDLDKVIGKLPENAAAILLAHEPDFADVSAMTGRFGLQLSGHSHGGQVVIPFRGAPLLPYLGQKYYSGLYKVDDMWQYTNRGAGMLNPPARFNCRPEITIFTLQSD